MWFVPPPPKKKGNGQRGLSPRLFQPNGGTTCPRAGGAPTCPNMLQFIHSLQVTIKTNLLAELKHQAPNLIHTFKPDALARCPQPMSSTCTFFFFSGSLLVLTAPWLRSVQNDPPFWLHVGVACPRNSTKNYILPPRDQHFPPLDRNRTTSWPLMTAPEAGIKTSRRHHPTARTDQGRNIQHLVARVVAIDFVGKKYDTIGTTSKYMKSKYL